MTSAISEKPEEEEVEDFKEKIMKEKLIALFDWFIPDDIKKDIREYGKAKMVVGIGLLLGIVIMLQSLRSFLVQVNIALGFVVIGFSLFAISGPFILKFTKSKSLAASITIASLFTLAIMVVLMRGGISSSITSYIVLVSICAMMMSGLWAGIIWGVLSFFAIVFIYSLGKFGIELPAHHLSPDEMQTYLLITYSALVVFTMILGAIYETTSNGNFLLFCQSQERSDQINAQLREALENVNLVMESVSQSDLSQRISYQLEGELEVMKTSVNNAISLLSQTLFQVTASSQKVQINSSELSKSAQSLANGTTTQASSLEEISSSMDEIEDLTKRNNENANRSKTLTQGTLDIVRQGNQEMQDMVNTMNHIAETGQNVTKVIKTIDEIAFQTNLLALNAAVEAARAGKYGKGFSVVAEEVRNLASRSAEAAKDTTVLIEATMIEMEKGVEKVDTTASILDKITSSTEEINNLVVEITKDSNEQRNGIEEITRALNQVNKIVQQNSSISEETAAASEELKTQSMQLMNTMQKFQLGGEFESTAINNKLSTVQLNLLSPAG